MPLEDENVIAPRAGRREWIGLAVIALACVLYVMDLTVLHLAVPAISADLRPSSAQLLWIIDIYGFLVAGSLITMGTLGDRIGRRRLLLIGAAAFGVASVLAAFSTSAGMLIATRALLGIHRGVRTPPRLRRLRVRGTTQANQERISMDTKRSHPSTLSIPQLRTDIKGRVIAPDDAGYDAARTVFYGGIDKRPAVIVRVADATDVSHVVSLARETGLELAVRSGGHSPAGHSVSSGGVVLDLGDMKALAIDAPARTAWAETGLTAAELTAAAAAHGLAIGFGDSGSVGIGGITLGGGVGFLARKHGLTIDSLLAAEVVTADGRILRADLDTHPDLFWAIRGGGGNFGVATRFQYRLHEVRTIVGGILILPASPDIIASFIAEAEAAPEELSTIANVMPAPPMPFVPEEHHGKLVVLAMLAYAGETEAGERAVAPFRALATPIADMVRPMPYPEIYLPEDEEYHPTAVGRTMFVDTIDRDVAETIFEYLRASDATMRVAQLRVLGGAMARVPADATAFAHRGSRIMVNVAAFYEGPEDRAVREAWVTDFAGTLRQGDTGAYVGFLADEGEARIRQAYPGPTWDRLAAIKRRYDPTNLFRLNQNVPPAIESQEGHER